MASAPIGFTPQETIKYESDTMTGALFPIFAPGTHFTLCDGINIAHIRTRHPFRLQ